MILDRSTRLFFIVDCRYVLILVQYPNPDKSKKTNHKSQIANKSQHAAQAPALRVTENTISKQRCDIEHNS